jgi:hypothetical protein
MRASLTSAIIGHDDGGLTALIARNGSDERRRDTSRKESDERLTSAPGR